jgi:hypothetical protein
MNLIVGFIFVLVLAVHVVEPATIHSVRTKTKDKEEEDPTEKERKTTDTQQQSKPNFIFFFPDTIRAESLSIYQKLNNEKTNNNNNNSSNNIKPPVLDISPRFDEFASQGTLFEQVHGMHTQCSPSRVLQ